MFSEEYAELPGYFTLAIKPISINASGFSKRVQRKISRVSDFDRINNTYSLSAYLIAQLGKNYTNGTNNIYTGDQLLQAALETIKELQYMAGGMVVFLEAENETKLLDFYEKQNGFKRFDSRVAKADTDDAYILIQLLKIL